MKRLFFTLALFIPMLVFSQVKLTSWITPNSPYDIFHLVENVHVKGGFMTVESIAIRDDYDGLLNPTGITQMRRTIGMLVYVQSTGLFYQLQGGIENSNWVTIQIGGGDACDCIFDTIRLSTGDKIWRLSISPNSDTIYFNNQYFVSSASGGNTLPKIDVDRPINLISNGTNIADLIGRNTLRLDSLVEMALYADTPPLASIVRSPNEAYFDYGYSKPITVSWTATKTSNPISEITISGVGETRPKTPTGSTQSGSDNFTLNGVSNNTISITVKDTKNMTATAATTYYPRHSIYFGTMPGDDHDAITSDDINGFEDSNFATSFSSVPADADDYYYIADCEGKFVYVAAPATFGGVVMANNTGNSMGTTLVFVKTLQHSNENNTAGPVSYNLFRTPTIQYGTAYKQYLFKE